MPDQTIKFAKKGHIAYITLNRPRAKNVINLTMAQELTEVCAQINGDDNIYVTIVTGAGKTFCAGSELKPAGLKYKPAAAIASLNCPVIAAVNGDALGGGLEIALACDIRLAAHEAQFGFPQIARGELPADGGTQRLPRIVGKGKAMELVLSGETIDEHQAQEIGLVSEIAEEVVERAEAIAQNIAGKGPVALKFLKEAVNKGLDLTLDQGMRLEGDLYFLLHTTTDRTEGITAFLQKRPPRFKNK